MPLYFDHGNRIIEFEIVYSKRKTMVISVDESGKVIVRSPHNIRQELILDRVKGKAGWIADKLDKITMPEEKEYADGELFMYLGRNYVLQLCWDKSATKPEVAMQKDTLLVRTSTEDKVIIKNAIELWYKNKARELIRERINHYQPAIKISPNRVTVKNQKKRWGSCSSKGNLNFNWRIMMAPLEIVDYIVVHEMCHLIHLNHSREYWQLVAAILPDYKKRRQWLKKNGAMLNL